MESKRKSIIFFCILGIIAFYFIINLYLNKKNKLIIENKDSKLISIKLQDKNGDYIDSEIDSWPKEGYIFNKELSTCENGGEVSYENGQIVLNTNGSEKCKIYFDIDNIGNRCKGKEFASCIKENYEIDGAIIYHNLEDATKKEFPNYNLVANDDSYRYAGSNDIVNNYVCFGADKCSDTENYDNLYRIIGIFDDNKNNQYKLKLIKADYITNDLEDNGAFKGTMTSSFYRGKYKSGEVKSFYWSSETRQNNNWRLSNLNTDSLNKVFYNNIPDDYRKMINYHTWIVGGNTYAKITGNNAKIVYDSELGENKLKVGDSGCVNTLDVAETTKCTDEDLEYPAYIGLIYVSDYFYSAHSKYWSLVGNDGTSDISEKDYTSTVDDNWLYLGQSESLITRDSGRIDVFFFVRPEGKLFNLFVFKYSNSNGGAAIRPAFYLNSDVKLSSGNGTISNPYILNIT